jgi:hypothetical protein
VPAYVVVHLASNFGSRRSSRQPVLKRADVKQLLSRHEAQLREFAGEQSGAVTIAVPDMARANTLAAALRGTDGVETAYAKPGEELP